MARRKPSDLSDAEAALEAQVLEKEFAEADQAQAEFAMLQQAEAELIDSGDLNLGQGDELLHLETEGSAIMALVSRGTSELAVGGKLQSRNGDGFEIVEPNVPGSKGFAGVRRDGSVPPQSQRARVAVSFGSSGPPYFPYFLRFCELLGFSKTRRVSAADGWEFWMADERRAAAKGPQSVRLVLIHRVPTQERLDEIGAAVRIPQAVRHRLVCVLYHEAEWPPELKDSPARARNKAWENQERTEASLKHYGAVDVWTLSSLVGTLREDLRGVGRAAETVLGEHFIEPKIQDPNGALLLSARQCLSDFLSLPHGAGIAVLTAPGGMGKTTVMHSIRNVGERFPVVIGDHEWAALQARQAPITVESLVREGFRKAGFPIEDLGILDVLTAHGGVCILFDSFDEVCSFTSTSPSRILGRILELTEVPSSAARILITSRDESWMDVDASLRDKCIVYRLCGFDASQQDQYLEKRLGEHKATLDRVRRRLNDIGNLRSSPLALALVCTAAEMSEDQRTGFDTSALIDLRQASDSGAASLLSLFQEVCRRESMKEGKYLPLDGSKQLELFQDLIIESGPAFSLEDFLILATESDYRLTEHQARYVIEHHVLLVRHGENSFGFRYRELEYALLEAAVVRCLRRLAPSSPPADPRIIAALKRVAEHYSDRCSSLGATCERALGRLSLSSLWPLSERMLPVVRGILFQLLASRLQLTEFLSLQDGRLIVSDALFRGALNGLNFSGVGFRNARFENVHIESCQFDVTSQFRDCTFICARIGKGCRGLGSRAFMYSQFDPETVRASQQWVQLPEMDPRQLLESAFDDVLQRAFALWQERERVSAFSNRTTLAEDPIEERVVSVLRRIGVLIGETDDLRLHHKHAGEARAYLNTRSLSGALGKAYAELNRVS